MTTRPLPVTPYRGPVISMSRPLPPTPSGSTTPAATLQRRAHMRRTPSCNLPSVSEEDEGDLAEVDEPTVEPVQVQKPRRRPRPAPLIPTRAAKLPLILEIPKTPTSSTDVYRESLALSPSTLFARRRSETILDFPLPPSSRTPVTPPRGSSASSSPSSSSSGSSSPYPLTPHPSDEDEDDYSQSPIKFRIYVPPPPPQRAPYRSSSVVSLRSFNTADFDAQAEPIYAMLQPNLETPLPSPTRPDLVKEIQAIRASSTSPNKWERQQPSPVSGHSDDWSQGFGRRELSVLDTAHGGSFEVPFVLGSFLDPPSSPCSSSNSDNECEGESDGEGIPLDWSSDCDNPVSAALSSSDDDSSDSDEEGPSRVLDPIFHADRRRVPLKPLNLELALLDMPDTPSVYSLASPDDWTGHHTTPPRDSIVPCDVFSRPSLESFIRPSLDSLSESGSSRQYVSLGPYRAPSPRSPSLSSPPRSRTPSPHPILRSRFSTSTLASIPEPPTSSSSKHAFFARLAALSKPSSGSKSQRGRQRVPSPSPHSPTHSLSYSPTSSYSPKRQSSLSTPTRQSSLSTPARQSSLSHRKRSTAQSQFPISPAPSAFSFSSSSRSSFDSSGDSSSCISDESTGSTGLRRPPIPIELFLRG